MQRNYFLMALAFLLAIAPAAPADAASGCAAKEAHIQAKIAAAKQQGNDDALRGLETALREVRRWCRDDSLMGKAEMRVQEKRAEVAEQELELREARLAGRTADKIAKRERKLRKAQEELRQAIAERDALKR